MCLTEWGDIFQLYLSAVFKEKPSRFFHYYLGFLLNCSHTLVCTYHPFKPVLFYRSSYTWETLRKRTVPHLTEENKPGRKAQQATVGTRPRSPILSDSHTAGQGPKRQCEMCSNCRQTPHSSLPRGEWPGLDSSPWFQTLNGLTLF